MECNYLANNSPLLLVSCLPENFGVKNNIDGRTADRNPDYKVSEISSRYMLRMMP